MIARLAALVVLGLAFVAPAVGAQRPAQRPVVVGHILAADLPPEALQTIARIRAGGPFPYARDGAVFGNREGALPRQRRGYYREYTVKTPHVRTRGARRIVWGAGGEFYYTDDHYNRFWRIRE